MIPAPRDSIETAGNPAGHLPGSADPWYMPDGLHHTSTGETAFEAAILETLAQCEEQR